ncbi:MAG TPA: serine hydrolase domain-containing protein [Candidatus Polarisedimenticolia bacterium]|nr:serine hydrolase domain-containing protein [Candidatus Polarisedimenticolia bacterium]
MDPTTPSCPAPAAPCRRHRDDEAAARLVRATRDAFSLLLAGLLAYAQMQAGEDAPRDAPSRPRPQSEAGTAARDDGLAAAIEAGRAAMRDRIARTATPGMAVAVASGGVLVWEEGFGVVDLETRASVTPATRFGLGSVSKSLTMALAGRLVDRGLLDLDAPIEKYLPDFPHAGKGISTRLIAGHLSGLDDTYAAAHWTGGDHFATTRDALAVIYKEPLRSEPGREHFYATGTYTLIAGVIEKASGLTFLEAMRRHVLEPLGLYTIVPNDPRAPAAGAATFYVSDDAGKPSRAPYYDPSHKRAGAGFLSTPGDLARFGAAMARPGFLTEKTLAEIFKPLKTGSGADTGVGLGWRIGREGWPGMGWTVGPDDQARRIVHQPGGGPGISCWLVLDLNSGVVVAILSNMTGAPVGGRHLDAILEAFAKAAAGGAAGRTGPARPPR